MKFLTKVLLLFFIGISYAKASPATDWLQNEIDKILLAYKNETISEKERFLLIEKTINENFAGAGIAKFVSGEAWNKASKEDKKRYIKIFKKHLALNIATMMQGYSNQEYRLINSKFDEKSKVSLIDMEILGETGKLLVTWRVKESKDRYYVIDLIVANISLVVTKRSEFNSMLRKVDNDLNQFEYRYPNY